MIAGYRVLRRLGSGSRADVYLGHAGENGSTVALKVFRPEADAGSVEREIQALSAAPDRRLPGLVDVATLPDGRACLVLELLSGGSLGRHLGEANRLEPGEAVTILAPVAAALAGVHAAGFAHGRVGPQTVIFDAWGRPVLAGLGELRELPVAGAPRNSLLRDDHARLAALVRSVFDHLDPQDDAARRADELAAWFDGEAAGAAFRPCLDELEHRLFDWAPAEAVRLGRPVGGMDAAARAPQVDGARLRREALRAPSAVAEPPGRGRPAPDRSPRGFGRLHRPSTMPAAARELLENRLLERLQRLWRDLPGLWRDQLRARRRPLLVAGLVAAAGTVLALTVIPAGEASSQAGQASDTRPSSSVRTTGAAATGRSASDAAALAGDDPVLAVPVLLRLRAECLAAASVICLDGVDQAGSAAMAADSYTVRLIQQGGSREEKPDDACCTVSLVERTGNSALVALAPRPGAPANSKPASALTIRGEAGWRLRELFDY